jgi:hypothetical protein
MNELDEAFIIQYSCSIDVFVTTSLVETVRRAELYFRRGGDKVT